MKKIKLNSAKLQLNKERIAILSDNQMGQIQGGKWSGGCTDGCGLFGTAWNCTRADCSANCSSSFCPATNTGSPGTMCYEGHLRPTDQDCVYEDQETYSCPRS